MTCPNSLLKLADQLLDFEVTERETADRAAVSRAYYAAYHACNVKYESRSNEKTGIHRKFINSLKNSTNITDKRVGYMLEDVYQGRITADYELDSAFTPESAAQIVGRAKKLCDLLATHDS